MWADFEFTDKTIFEAFVNRPGVTRTGVFAEEPTTECYYYKCILIAIRYHDHAFRKAELEKIGITAVTDEQLKQREYEINTRFLMLPPLEDDVASEGVADAPANPAEN